MIAEYLTAALEDENPDVFLAAVVNVAKVRGMTAIAESTGLGRESLYKAMTPGAKPRYDTVLKVLHSLGVKLTVSAA
ncbi:addiction module antidote protein [Lentisalinibacter orientalis]|uniref:addiction module antidote protein n=1 Tax=Lentisalinibacter orientalis TaxID=2992241 RepID=UPI00386FE640